MDGRFVLGLVLVLAIAVPLSMVPGADARGPGGACVVREEYVTEAHITGDPTNGNLAFHWGAERPIECYY